MRLHVMQKVFEKTLGCFRCKLKQKSVVVSNIVQCCMNIGIGKLAKCCQNLLVFQSIRQDMDLKIVNGRLIEIIDTKDYIALSILEGAKIGQMLITGHQRKRRFVERRIVSQTLGETVAPMAKDEIIPKDMSSSSIKDIGVV